MRDNIDRWMVHVGATATQQLDMMIMAAADWFDKPLDVLFNVKSRDELLLASPARKRVALLRLQPMQEVGGRDDFFVAQHRLGRLSSRPR